MKYIIMLMVLRCFDFRRKSEYSHRNRNTARILLFKAAASYFIRGISSGDIMIIFRNEGIGIDFDFAFHCNRR